jgi:hypothetical protein
MSGHMSLLTRTTALVVTMTIAVAVFVLAFGSAAPAQRAKDGHGCLLATTNHLLMKVHTPRICIPEGPIDYAAPSSR